MIYNSTMHFHLSFYCNKICYLFGADVAAAAAAADVVSPCKMARNSDGLSMRIPITFAAAWGPILNLACNAGDAMTS
jgi:hypothetical protein